MKEAAKHKNFYAKISGLGKLPTDLEKWNSGYVKPHISFALEVFGEDRCMCGQLRFIRYFHYYLNRHCLFRNTKQFHYPFN